MVSSCNAKQETHYTGVLAPCSFEIPNHNVLAKSLMIMMIILMMTMVERVRERSVE